MRHLRKYRQRRVTVVMSSGVEVTTFEGRLEAADRDGIELSDVHLVAEHDATVTQALEGSLWLPAYQTVSVQIREG